MIPELERRSMLRGNEVFSFWDDSEKEIDVLLGEHQHQHQQRYHGDGDEIERELNLYRSGSAPPTVDSSLNASRGLFNGGGGGAPFLELGGVNNENNEFSKDPSYLSYCYDNTKLNLNPRLPPPLMSREDLRVAQRLKESSNVFGDMRNGNESQSLFSMPLGFEQMKKQQELEAEKNSASSSEWDANGLLSLDIGGKKKSFADIFQDDMGHSHLSRPASLNAFDENVDSARNQSPSAICAPSQYSYAAVLGSSLSRNGTPDPQIIARVPSPCLTPIGSGRASSNDKRNASNQSPFNGLTSGLKESSDLTAALGGMNLSSNGGLNGGQAEQDVEKVSNYMFGHNEVSQHLGSAYNGGVGLPGPYKSDQASNATHSWRNSQMRGSQDSAYNGGVGLPGPYQHLDSPNYSLNSYTLNPSVASSKMASQIGNNNFCPSYNDVYGMDSRLHGGGFVSPGQNLLSESHNLGRVGHRMMGGDAGLPSHVADPMYHQYARFPENSDLLNGPSMDMSLMGSSYMNMLELQRAYLGAQKPHYGGVPYKLRSPNSHSYYGSPAFGSNMLYPDTPLAHHVMSNSLVAPLSPRGEVNMRYPSATRNYAGGIMGSRLIDASLESLDESIGSSLLEEFKRDKTRGFELYEIAGHVGEFSGDQFGSRFIQQKLETATTDEKNMIYEEIMPQALTLMTDVFGNYVIQKFFELGLPAHRREIAEKLFSQVLSLSLQMYGCRVIQKAIEVVDLDQKIMMVKELEGHVMRCVRDQNGNHVVQKCIECVPEENIDFIISTFFGHIVTLSTHPYGCRVIQRVLEHCHDMDTQRKVMEEILSSVSLLAQDQYGNYVIQHVLEHGKPVERTVIIKELAGNMVLMSQQKYASNVVEKCLTFGGSEERELLVNEMMGTTDENEPLQAMMKDQFANYVVQKVLETCDDQHRELILGRIKVHLDALKKYTYGKHIVSRVEKLVTAGERRMASQSLNQHRAA